MIKIAICDDDKSIIDEEVSILNVLFNEIKIEVGILTFISPFCLLEDIKKINIDIVLLDIGMELINGIAVAKKIRSISQDTIIIFITSYLNYFTDAFRLKAFQYISKPLDKMLFCQEIVRAVREIEARKKIFLIKYKGSEWLIPLYEIAYLESCGRYVYVYTKKDVYTTISKLENEGKKLNSSIFIRIHKSTIVNINYISMIKGDNIYLKGNFERTLHISRNYKDHVVKTFMKFRLEVV